MKIAPYLILSLLVCIPLGVEAIGISVTPAVLRVRSVQGEEAITRFVVTNPSTEVGLFETYSEEFQS